MQIKQITQSCYQRVALSCFLIKKNNFRTVVYKITLNKALKSIFLHFYKAMNENVFPSSHQMSLPEGSREESVGTIEDVRFANVKNPCC